jgi:hypothetical protein
MEDPSLDELHEAAPDTIDDDEDNESDGYEQEHDEAGGIVEPIPPSTSLADAMPFSRLVQRMENVWQATLKKNSQSSPSIEDRLKYLLPPKEVRMFLTKTNPRQTIFPIFRLLLPHIDTRQIFLKESKIALMYIAHFNLDRKTHRDAIKLEHYNDPHFVEGSIVGDFALVLQSILERRLLSSYKTKLTVGEINRLLDDLAAIGRTRQGRDGVSVPSQASLMEQRANWLRSVMNHHLSAIEHKWLVRIMTRDMKFGIRHKTLLEWYHPLAMDAYTSHNSLKMVLHRLCGLQPSTPQNNSQRPESTELNKIAGESSAVLPYLRTFSGGTIKIGVPFTPMFSERTSFERLLSDVSRHHEYYRRHTIIDDHRNRQHHNQGWECLAIRHPAFSVETKLDGERLLIHHHRNGLVHMHTRNSNWYR